MTIFLLLRKAHAQLREVKKRRPRYPVDMVSVHASEKLMERWTWGMSLPEGWMVVGDVSGITLERWIPVHGDTIQWHKDYRAWHREVSTAEENIEMLTELL